MVGVLDSKKIAIFIVLLVPSISFFQASEPQVQRIRQVLEVGKDILLQMVSSTLAIPAVHEAVKKDTTH